MLVNGMNLLEATNRRTELVMPLYVYQCKECGYSFEKLSSTYSSKDEKCPKCGGVAKKQMGNIAHFEFKGNLA